MTHKNKIKKHGDFVFEMANPLELFKLEIRNLGARLYHRIIYICILGNELPNRNEQWKKEITTLCLPLLDADFDKRYKEIDRGELIREHMMSHYMGAQFEDYDVYQFDYALQCLIMSIKREPENKKLKSKELEIVQEVKSHLEGLPELCFETISRFYDNFIKAANERDPHKLFKAINDIRPVV